MRKEWKRPPLFDHCAGERFCETHAAEYNRGWDYFEGLSAEDAAARAAGQVGEQPDGYLGFATTPTPAIRALVQDINIKRKAKYTESAQATGSTVEQFAFTSGCNLIASTRPGEKYQAPDGRWLTRDDSPPVRNASCP